MSVIRVFLLFNILILILCTITSLPITSKPIENTPEHLAWEAWIMVPTNHDKTRKITPKSIFIVPNGTNGGVNGNNGGGGGSGTYMPQIQCPPGHTFDNFKCIPTVNIDQSQILITRLTNLVHSTDKYNGSSGNTGNNYDYDYEYDTDETDDSKGLTQTGGGSNPSDYNGEPLKINLSLGKFPINQDEDDVNKDKDDSISSSFAFIGDVSGEDEDTLNGSSHDVDVEEIKLQPFRGKETSSTTTEHSTILQNSKSNSDDVSSIAISIRDTTNSTTVSTTTATPTPTATGSTTVTPSKLNDSISEQSSALSTRITSTNNTTSPIHLLSPSESEMVTKIDKTHTGKESQDFDLDDQSTSRSTTIEDDLDIVTSLDESKINLKDEMEKDSLILEYHSDTKTTTEISETTDTDDEEFQTTTPLNQLEDDRTDIIQSQDDDSTEMLKVTVAITKQPTIRPDKSGEEDDGKKHQIPKNDEKQSESSQTFEESVQVHNDAAPLMETIESNNRYIYHHLGAVSSPKIETTTISPDIREQLRLINKIVEENKRRVAQQQQQSNSHIKFPSAENESHRQHHSQVHHNRYGNVRSDFVRFPESEGSSSSSHLIHIPFYHKSQSPEQPIYFQDRRYFQPSPPIQPTVIAPTKVGGDENKPSWWLPTGWEVDRTGDRPFMVRFWSRMPTAEAYNSRSISSTSPTSSSSTTTTTTTSRYRENSRSPTENLYRQEIMSAGAVGGIQQLQQQQQQQYSGHDIYRVLGAKQHWKHNNR